jgi:hypothetical protein
MIPYDAIAEIINVLDHVSKGNVPTKACDDLGVSYTTFCRLTATYPQLRHMREEAEDRCYDTLADRLLTIHEDIEDPKMANVASANVKWLLERRRSKAYGAKSTLEVNLTADREVLDALQSAKARAEGRHVETSTTGDILDLSIVAGVARAVSIDEFDEAAHLRELAEIS